MGYHHFVALCGLFIMMWYDRTGELWFDLKNDLCMGESGMICCNGFVWKYRSQNPANDHRPEIGIFCACLGQAKNFSTESPLPRKRFIVRWSPQSTMGLPMKPSLRPRIFRKRRSRWRKLKFHSQSQDRTDQILHRISWSRGTLRAAPSHCKWVERTFYLTFYSTFSTQFLPICFFLGRWELPDSEDRCWSKWLQVLWILQMKEVGSWAFRCPCHGIHGIRLGLCIWDNLYVFIYIYNN